MHSLRLKKFADRSNVGEKNETYYFAIDRLFGNSYELTR